MATTTEYIDASGVAVAPEVRGRRRKVLSALAWGVRLGVALFVFVGGLQVMKLGTAGLDVLGDNGLLVRNAGSTLGLGWLGAVLLLSGSPVAASSLALLAGGSITRTEAFSMLAGSRLGAAFVVLLVGVLYAVRGGAGKRGKPVSTAVIALFLTGLLYVPGTVIGLALLRIGPLHDVNWTLPTGFVGVTEIAYGWMLDRIEGLGGLVLFAGGLGILLLSFKLIDGLVPDLRDTTLKSARADRFRRKWPMFGLGCVVALVTMSVSVALTLLIPLISKNYVTRKQMLPYIMGANITTLGDTLLAAFALGSGPAVQVVVAMLAGTTVVSLLLLAVLYEPLSRRVMAFQAVVMGGKLRLSIFTASLFVIPIGVIAVSATVR